MGCGCGCSGDCAGALDPLVALASRSSTMGDLLPTIVLPGDVDRFKAQLDPDMRATEGAASRCAELPAAEAIAWGDFYTEWRKFADKPTPIVSSWSTELQIAKSYEARLREWQRKLSGEHKCAMRSPEIPGGSFPWVTAALVAAGVVVVGAVGYSVYRAGSQASARARRGRELLESRIDEHVFGELGAPRRVSRSRSLARR